MGGIRLIFFRDEWSWLEGHAIQTLEGWKCKKTGAAIRAIEIDYIITSEKPLPVAPIRKTIVRVSCSECGHNEPTPLYEERTNNETIEIQFNVVE